MSLAKLFLFELVPSAAAPVMVLVVPTVVPPGVVVLGGGVRNRQYPTLKRGTRWSKMFIRVLPMEPWVVSTIISLGVR